MSSQLVTAIERFQLLKDKRLIEIQKCEANMRIGTEVEWNQREIEIVKKSLQDHRIHLAKMMHTDLGFLIDRIIENK